MNNLVKKEPDKDTSNPEDDEDFMRFMTVMESCHDDVTKILRSHLLAEYYIDKLLLITFSRGDVLLTRFNYLSQKLHIVEAMSVAPKELIDSLYNLNSVRNDCGHELNYQVLEKDVDKIGRPFGIEYEKLKKEKKTLTPILKYTLMMLIAKLCSVINRIYEKESDKLEHG